MDLQAGINHERCPHPGLYLSHVNRDKKERVLALDRDSQRYRISLAFVDLIYLVSHVLVLTSHDSDLEAIEFACRRKGGVMRKY